MVYVSVKIDITTLRIKNLRKRLLHMPRFLVTIEIVSKICTEYKKVGYTNGFF